jgi:pilus assembly protein CpaD
MESTLIRPVIIAIATIALPFGAAEAGRYNRTVETIHQPVVQRSDFVLDVSGNGLDPVAAAHVEQWFGVIGLGYGDRVSIDTSAGTAGSNHAIAAIVSRYGMFVSEGAPVTQGVIQPGNVRIIVSRWSASVPGCPDFSQASQPNFAAASSSNYGCAIESTLAAMVANPEDLVQGQIGNGSTADTAAKAIRVWRNSDPTAKGGLKIETTKGGNQ